MHRGYIALWRKIQDHPFAKERRVFSKYEAWIDILMECQHCEEAKKVIIGMAAIDCHYGESLKSIKTWACRWQWTESKVRRFFDLLKNLGQITTKSEGQTTRLIVLNYGQYDPRSARVTAELRRGNDEVTATDNNVKNEKKDIYCRVVDYLNRKANTSYRPSTKATRGLIKARMNEGFVAEDFKAVIDNQCKKWLTDPEMVGYLRPSTLFGTKFESYLNKPKVQHEQSAIQPTLEEIMS